MPVGRGSSRRPIADNTSTGPPHSFSAYTAASESELFSNYATELPTIQATRSQPARPQAIPTRGERSEPIELNGKPSDHENEIGNQYPQSTVLEISSRGFRRNRIENSVSTHEQVKKWLGYTSRCATLGVALLCIAGFFQILDMAYGSALLHFVFAFSLGAFAYFGTTREDWCCLLGFFITSFVLLGYTAAYTVLLLLDLIVPSYNTEYLNVPPAGDPGIAFIASRASSVPEGIRILSGILLLTLYICLSIFWGITTYSSERAIKAVAAKAQDEHSSAVARVAMAVALGTQGGAPQHRDRLSGRASGPEATKQEHPGSTGTQATQTTGQQNMTSPVAGAEHRQKQQATMSSPTRSVPPRRETRPTSPNPAQVMPEESSSLGDQQFGSNGSVESISLSSAQHSAEKEEMV